MRYVQFVFLREGSSDDGLIDHLQTLLVDAGADEVFGERRVFRGKTEEKLRAFVDEDFHVDVIFVHRDADGAGREARVKEILEAAGAVDGCPRVIPVVPVRCTEAWLLSDEAAIRLVAGKPSATHHIDMPNLALVEGIADPKSTLKDLIGQASDASGGDLARINREFDRNRSVLLGRLDPFGRVVSLDSWAQLVADIRDFMSNEWS
jgi:hypothetical protein